MEHAKKLILVEPRLLEQLQTQNEYKEIQKPGDLKAKSNLSLDMKTVLADPDIGDDIKAKLYQQTFSRYMNLTDEVPSVQKGVINRLTPPQAPWTAFPLSPVLPEPQRTPWPSRLRPRVARKKGPQRKKSSPIVPPSRKRSRSSWLTY